MRQKVGAGLLQHLIASGLAVSALIASPASAGEYIVKFKSDQEFNYTLNRAKSTIGSAATQKHRRGLLAKFNIKSKDDRDEARQVLRLMNRPDVEYVVESFDLYALENEPVQPEPPADADRPITNPEEPVEQPDEPIAHPEPREPNAPEEPVADPEPEQPVEPEKPQEPVSPPPVLHKQWALEKVRASEAWSRVTNQDEIIVAVIDTGVDGSHEDLATQMWVNPNEIAGNGIDDDNNGYIDDVYGWDFFDNDNNPDDITSARNKGHGTHCAGIIGAVNDNKGVSGIANNVKIMPLRFLGPNGNGDLMNSIKAIDYAIAQGAHIISASWGARVPESRAKPLIEAIERAEKAGILFVAAAANNGRSNDSESMFPANTLASNMISVAASNIYDQKPHWSNYGEGRVHLSAPGENIMSTLPGNTYDSLSGTSMATPLVAGLAAVMLSEIPADKRPSPAEIRAIMQASGSKVKIETACNCRIDAVNALEYLHSESFTVVPHAATVGLKKSQQFATWGQSEGKISYKVTDTNIATIDDSGRLLGLRKGATKVIATDEQGRVAETLDVRVGLSGAPKLCPFSSVRCFFTCIVSWKQPWCIWNKNKMPTQSLQAQDLISFE